MNNIEILEEFIENYRCSNSNVEILYKEVEALENLIEDYKELKTKLQDHICIEAHEQVKQLYVPKSKVKEK